MGTGGSGVGRESQGRCPLIRAEARHRLKVGKGVLIFSRPDRLKQWMKKNEIDYDSRRHLIVDAGRLVPGFSKEGAAQAEFFVHSPFGWRLDETTVIDRNEASIVMQVTFREGHRDSYLLLGSDIDHETISEIVQVTKTHGNEERLLWDLMKLFHHCSYLALGPERGTDETKAVPDVKWLFRNAGTGPRHDRIAELAEFPSRAPKTTRTFSRHTVRRPTITAAWQSRSTAVYGHDGGAFPNEAAVVRLQNHHLRRCLDRRAPMVSVAAAAATPRAGY